MVDEYGEWMRRAVVEARGAAASGDVPVGALVFDASGTLLSAAHNERELRQDPTAHAEILALRAAAERLGDWQLLGTTLVVTLEPCPMCAGAILAARVPVVVFGAWDEKAGAAGSVHDLLRDRRLPHRVEVFAGVETEACARLLTEFFGARR
jgi:tRNA(adenine34) deaminase